MEDNQVLYEVKDRYNPNHSYGFVLWDKRLADFQVLLYTAQNNCESGKFNADIVKIARDICKQYNAIYLESPNHLYV